MIKKTTLSNKNDLIIFHQNPHFIYNALNNIYSLILMDQDKALTAVQNLSTLFRFTSKEMTNSFIPLNDEVEYIKSFVELEKLRLKKPENVLLNINIDLDYKIPPIIFIPFVENAFKHGELKENDSFLYIDIKAKNNKLYFHIKNKIKNISASKDSISGISIASIKERLENIYHDKAQIKIINDDAIYEVEIIILL